ncbi:MAG: CRISPR-associated protein Csn1 [Prevotellaceae bacterium]|nr:CRISPR-associated protein Csn1 [Prevotellaceae bacterium]
MKQRTIGIDTGTNSIGWAVVDYDCEAEENQYELVDKGVHIFQEGVKIEKGIESSRAAERTGHRRLRIGYWRRKLRKIALLKILVENGLCPYLSPDELKKWRRSKYNYPLRDDFMLWQRTDENDESTNPYYCRSLCVTKRLDLRQERNRYMLGRALYHINQRRGFLSNRKEDTKESEGDVKKGIDSITARMEERGAEYLGQYFWQLYQENKKAFKEENKIRCQYTSRLAHYEKELLKICEVQGLSEELTRKLHKAIIVQRPLKSQKQSVGKCVFEPDKPRCPVSHPLFEQYRMYQFINNIKMRRINAQMSLFGDESGNNAGEIKDLLPLSDEQKRKITHLFLRKSRKVFDFSDIAKELAGSKNFAYYKDKVSGRCDCVFNYHSDFSVSGCPVTAQLAEAFGVKEKSNIDSWLDAACEQYTLTTRKKANAEKQPEEMGKEVMTGKSRFEIMNDIWHALFFFEDEEKLKAFAIDKLQLDDEHATMFSKIHLPSDYASLSLKAIRKILPYMKHYGLIYPHAVFLANITSVVPCKTDSEALLPMLPKEDADDIVGAFYEYEEKRKNNATEVATKEEYLKLYIAHKYHLDEKGVRKLERLYHPSMVETFPKVLKTTDYGYYQLGSPRTGSMRNPMAMHSLFRLRHVINSLLREGKIDRDTTINIEFARELNDANRRVAVRRWQNDLEKIKKGYADKIREDCHLEPTETDILKYKLWDEQNHICLYTGKEISLSDLFDANKFDIEHTIPRSVGGDSTDMNLTICESKFNRNVKQTMIPTELTNHEDIMERIAHWKDKIEDLRKQVRKLSTKGIGDKETKDGILQRRHRLQLELDYWKGKYNRFTMKEVPEGFSRRQGVDISIISRYARLYLKSLFPKVNVVKGIATADFRKAWGLQSEYEKKQRVNHCHHAIDAITIACIGKEDYDKIAQYYRNEEQFRWGQRIGRPIFPKPWATFTQDVLGIENDLLVSHYTADNMGKRTVKNERKQGKLTGRKIAGDTARYSLHMDTYYGAIEREGEIKYVLRTSLDKLDEKNVKNIVDDVVRQKVMNAIGECGSLKEALKAGIWMNKEKGIMIKKVRVFSPMVKNPLHIRKQRDVSPKEHKRKFHVMNDFNYTMGIYVGKDKRGREKRDFVLINCLDATRHYKTTNYSAGLLPEVSPDNKYPLRWTLKIGSMVLLYEKDANELIGLSNKELCKRLYKVQGFSYLNSGNNSYGRITFTHHQEARPSSDVKIKNGAFKQGEEKRAGILLLHTQFNALVEGCDFTMNELGEITFLHR